MPADGGEGDDTLDRGDDLREAGNDRITGSSPAGWRHGDYVLRKTGGTASGSLAGGPGDDAQSDDGWADQPQCGAGTDVVTNADEAIEMTGPVRAVGAGAAPPPAKAQVTVSEPPRGRSRPGRDGRLAVWMRCTVPSARWT